MKYQLLDDPSVPTMAECSKQILAQLLGAMAFSGSIAMGLVTFEGLSRYPGLGSMPMMVLFALSLVGAAIAFFTISLCIGLAMASVKLIQAHAHHKGDKAWRMSHVHHI
ncbi:MAG: hypothetical protein VKJ64_21830 [Leptolyngbyaceae bacterium]|nr:hypothetical protein [Leptolyngbyaceae bacterium]